MIVHTLEYHSATKKDEILPFAIIWMKAENMMLNEISQAQNDKCMISLMCRILCKR
jgi:hypothetical protein